MSRIFIACFVAICLSLIGVTAAGYYGLYQGASGLLLGSAEPVGGDFIAFYTGGSLLSGNLDLTNLFDFPNQLEFQRELLGSDRAPFLPFVYPPVVGLFFIPFSLLALIPAYLLWVAISFAFYFASAELLIRADNSWLKNHRVLLYLALLSFTPFTIDNIAGGQLAAIGIFLFSLAYFLIRRERCVAAGVVLAFTFYKAPLFALLLLGLVVTHRKQLFVGLATTCTIMGTLELTLFGVAGYQHYIEFVLTYLTGNTELLGFQVPSHIGVGVYAPLWSFTVYALPITVILMGGLLWVFYRRNSGRESLPPHAFANLLVASMALSFQVNNYDLSLLMCALILWVTTFSKRTKREQAAILLSALFIVLHVVGFAPETAVLPAVFVLSWLLSSSNAENLE